MKAKLTWDKALRFVGTNERGHETYFDSTVKGGGLDSAPGPMEIVLQSAAACTAMDVVAILHKKRKTVTEFSIDLTAERAEQYPKVFTKIFMDFRLVSPDATKQDLVRAIELSQSTYCNVSIMLTRSGCEITWRAELVTSPALRPDESRDALPKIEKTEVALGGTA